jgi:hypothetical protein
MCSVVERVGASDCKPVHDDDIIICGIRCHGQRRHAHQPRCTDFCVQFADANIPPCEYDKVNFSREAAPLGSSDLAALVKKNATSLSIVRPPCDGNTKKALVNGINRLSS